MFQIIEVFLGFSIGVAILWVTILALAKFTRTREFDLGPRRGRWWWWRWRRRRRRGRRERQQ